MPDYVRDYFRLACLLQQALLRLHRQEITFSLPGWEFENCQRLHRKLNKARSRNFAFAATHVARDLGYAVNRLHENLTSLVATVWRSSITPRIPSSNELYSEVHALFEEFDEIDFDLKRREITVTTEAIELDKIYLGEFAIQLDLNELGRLHPYVVIAKNPKHASGDESVTHPHIKNRHLCEGEGEIAIKRALESGRLTDFFQIVTQILHTYNSESAYAQLDAWSGTECADCGGITPADDIRACERCESSVCEACLSSCESCGNRVCGDCREGCSGCGACHCSECVNSCEDCEEKFCQSCLSDGKCKTCHECNRTEHQSGTGGNLAAAADPTATSEADAALQSAGVGETPVLT